MDNSAYRLVPFNPEHGAAVAEWIESHDELFMLAPQTEPPLTPAKVRGWSDEADRPFVFQSAAGVVTGYGELNQIPAGPGQLWLGHFVVAPQARGRRVAAQFLSALLTEAFDRLAADSLALVVFPENAAAIRCYRAAGFVDLGIQRRKFPGSFVRHELRHMRILRESYEQERRSAPSSKPALASRPDNVHAVADCK